MKVIEQEVFQETCVSCHRKECKKEEDWEEQKKPEEIRPADPVYRPFPSTSTQPIAFLLALKQAASRAKAKYECTENPERDENDVKRNRRIGFV